MRVVIDAMGGDFAPGVVIDGAVAAARDGVCHVTLVGVERELREHLARHGSGGAGIDVVDAPDVVDMAETPLAALRRKPAASIRVAMELIAAGRADALFSAGHTGATLVTAHAVLGVLPGVERPALAVRIPTRTGSAVLVDAGANVDCRASQLVQFGIMGAAYVCALTGALSPRVGLLSIGEEVGKGNDLVKEAFGGLSRASLNFVGNVDASRLFSGDVDVIVCDGFAGNVALKAGEGAVDLVTEMLHVDLGADLTARIRQRVDYAEHGAAPLLGVNGLVLVGHGRSSAHAVRSGIAAAAQLVTQRLMAKIAETFAALGR